MKSHPCQLHSISKAFGNNDVLRGIDMALHGGKATVLMGANGAGKSTLVKVLSGVHKADDGHMTVFGHTFSPKSPSDAIRQGVVTVHQSINDGVLPHLDVATNLALDQLGQRQSGFFINRRKMRDNAREIAASMQLDVDVTAPVHTLGLADKQMIAIARAMAGKPKILILDEPTSSLSSNEANRLFGLIERLKSTGVAILYISHRMSDIRRIADRIVAMRDGQVSGTFETAPLDYPAAVKAMLGHDIADVRIDPVKRGKTALTLRGLVIKPQAEPLDLSVAENEVIAFIGLLGSGKSRLASILFGLESAFSGEMLLYGKPYSPANPKAAMHGGVFLCARDRTSNAIIPAFDIVDNTTLPFFARHSFCGFLSRSSQLHATEQMISQLSIVCQSARDAVTTLSGGNQQKVIIGRWLYQSPRLLLLDEPFQGVDIKSRRDIGQRIRRSATGRATLVFVSEIDEALEIADRLVILHEHSIMDVHENGAVPVETLAARMTGVSAKP